MFQVVDGWHGLPDGYDEYGETKFRYVHTPQETYQNQFRPWEAGADPYVGEIHEGVERWETETTTTRDDEVVINAHTERMRCKVCGWWDDEDNGDD